MNKNKQKKINIVDIIEATLTGGMIISMFITAVLLITLLWSVITSIPNEVLLVIILLLLISYGLGSLAMHWHEKKVKSKKGK